MKRADINRLMREQFPNCTIDRIINNGNKSIVQITDETGNRHVAEVQQYQGVFITNFVSDY